MKKFMKNLIENIFNYIYFLFALFIILSISSMAGVPVFLYMSDICGWWILLTYIVLIPLIFTISDIIIKHNNNNLMCSQLKKNI